jgi:urease accessory protein
VARGAIELAFARAPGGETFVGGQRATYPFHVCRPHRFTGDPAGMVTLYVQSCAGGIFADDRLQQSIAAGTGAEAHVTTSAATIVHGMVSGDAAHETRLVAEEGALLEFLPDPSILFPQARLRTRLAMRAHPEATIIACDSFLMHDPTGTGRVFDHLRGEIVVEGPSGEIVALDRSALHGEAMMAGLPGIAGRFRACATLMVLTRRHAPARLVEALRGALAADERAYGGASTLPGEAGAWVRLLAEDGPALRQGLQSAWSAARMVLTGSVPQPRRK